MIARCCTSSASDDGAKKSVGSMGTGTTVWVRLENGRTRTAGSSAVTVGSASETAVISSASAAARAPASSAPALRSCRASVRMLASRASRSDPGVVIAGTESLEHEVGALDQPRRVIDRVDDDVGLTRDGLHVGLRCAVREFTCRARQDRHQFVGGAEHGLGLGNHCGQHRGVDFLDRQLGSDDDGGRLDRIDLIVQHVDHGTLARQHLGQRILGEHDDDVEVVVLQRSARGRLVRGVPARVDEALEHVVVLGDGLLIERVRRADEHGPQPEALAAIPRAEEHQERERARG